MQLQVHKFTKESKIIQQHIILQPRLTRKLLGCLNYQELVLCDVQLPMGLGRTHDQLING